MSLPTPRSTRRIPLALLAFSLGASLTGCANPPWVPPSAQAETPPPEVKPKPPKPRPAKPSGNTAAKPTDPSQAGAPAAGQTAGQSVAPSPGQAGGQADSRSPQVASIPRTPAATSPARLVGRDEAGIRALFGAPAGRTERPPARIWTYEGTGCRLELSFYMDVASRTFRVLTYDITPMGPTPSEGEHCLASLGTAKG